jgi:sRNA-binding carbon storage regulator CsrA
MLVIDRGLSDYFEIFVPALNKSVEVHICKIIDGRVKVGIQADKNDFVVYRPDMKNRTVTPIVNGNKNG